MASIKVLGGKINADGSRQVQILVDDLFEKTVLLPASAVLPEDIKFQLQKHAEHVRSDQFFKTLQDLQQIDVHSGEPLQGAAQPEIVAPPAPPSAPGHLAHTNAGA